MAKSEFSIDAKEFLKSFVDMFVILAQVSVWNVTKLEQVANAKR